MIRAVFFDMGGTLDGELHWLERFIALYKSFGLQLPRESIREAFDKAERQSLLDEAIVSTNLAQMIARHVEWQLPHLGLEDPKLRTHLVNGFISAVRKATQENVRLLAALADRGFELGVVSNGCGNVATLCQDFGYAPYLTVIVDSRRANLFKPDPAIYRHAAKELGRDPGTIMMVGDSFDRDVIPAKKTGMKTAWLKGIPPRDCPDPTMVDLFLARIADLPSALSATSFVRT
jgi:putative hydrolase of the HAD superfamily